jgi:succinylglutamate desuccinylase
VYFVVNNLKTAEAYIMSGTTGKKNKYRYIDTNMNRLPEDLRTRRNDARYEIRRARELLPVWRQFDVGFDIHSTSQDSPPMLIGGRIPRRLVRDFPIRIVLTNIDIVQIGLPAFGFYGNPRGKKVTVEIEAGGHEHPASLRRAQTCAVMLLEELGMLTKSRRSAARPGRRREYRVCDSVVFPDASYRLIREFKDGERIRKGQLLATGSTGKIVAKKDGHVFFCPKGGKMKSTSEEALFLTEPVRLT